jgi:2-dehydropantoate 2-reductase|tara:strand:- start:2385 stop:3347 length:963 start_codon:yes stop_codon:yes gene_type:complete
LSTPTFNHIAVVGAGAVGSFFGAMLARAGHSVTLIGRPAHVQATMRDGLKLDLATSSVTEIIRIEASSDLSSLRTADLVLFCVKSTDSASVALQIAPYLAPNALIMSLQNGVENAALIAQHVPHAVIPSVVYVATEIPAPGFVKHNGRGDLVIGTMKVSRLSDPQKTLNEIVVLFDSAQVPVQISQNVMAELWSKLMINCAFNAISGLAQIQYEKLAALESVRSTQVALVREVIAVAHADGIHLSEPVALQAVAQISITMGSQKSSTAQDMARFKPSEIDHLNGFIVRRGQELGVATPVNQALFALVKLVESTYTAHVES